MAEKTTFYDSLRIDRRMAEDQRFARGNSELGKNEFMQLLITQLQNQDPTNPQDNTEYIAQLAQFSSLEGIQTLNETVNKFSTSLQSTQALQASSLVGRSVEVKTNVGTLTEDNQIKGTVMLSHNTDDLVVNVYRNGAYLGPLSLGAQYAGEIPFSWDGMVDNDDGEGSQRLPLGQYTFEAKALNGETKQYAGADLYMATNVDSVQFNAGGGGDIMLNLQGVGKIPLKDVKSIN